MIIFPHNDFFRSNIFRYIGLHLFIARHKGFHRDMSGLCIYGRFVQDPYPGVSINPAYHFPYAVVAITSSQRADTARPVCS